MSNVIVTKNSKNNEEEIRVPHREEEDFEMIPVMYMYSDSEKELCGTLSIIDHRESVSIEALREEIHVQREALKTGFDQYGEEVDFDEIILWDEHGFLVCKEGVFVWNWDSEDYELIGTVRRSDSTCILQ